MKDINIDSVAHMFLTTGRAMDIADCLNHFAEGGETGMARALAQSQIREASKVLIGWDLVAYCKGDSKKLAWSGIWLDKTLTVAQVKDLLFAYKYGSQAGKITDPKQIVKVTGLDLAKTGPPLEMGPVPEGVRPSEHLLAKNLPFAQVYGEVDEFPRPLTREEQDFIRENYTGLGVEDYEFGTLLTDEVGHVYIEITRCEEMTTEGQMAWAIAVGKTAAAMTWASDYSELVRPQVLRVNEKPNHICILLASIRGYGEPALVPGWADDEDDSDLVRDAEVHDEQE